MNNAYLLIGGNLGDRLGNLKNATKEIELHCGKILSSSAIYETAAWGFTEQPPFFNQAIQVETALSASELMQQLLTIELSLGRERLLPLGPRSIDIDIIYFNSEIIQSEIVTIPQPKNGATQLCTHSFKRNCTQLYSSCLKFTHKYPIKAVRG